MSASAYNVRLLTGFGLCRFFTDCYYHGVYQSGKPGIPGKVREFKSGQGKPGKVREFDQKREKVREKYNQCYNL